MKKYFSASILLLLGVFVVYECYKNFISQRSLVGGYINKNFDYQGVLSDIPYQTDTLRLLSDNTFTSSYWGKGTYKLKYSLTGTKIELIYHYQYGLAGFSTTVTRLHGVTPVIILDELHNHYLEKTRLWKGSSWDWLL